MVYKAHYVIKSHLAIHQAIVIISIVAFSILCQSVPIKSIFQHRNIHHCHSI